MVLTQVALLPTQSRELLLEGVVVLRGSRDDQQPPLGHESKWPQTNKQTKIIEEFCLVALDDEQEPTTSPPEQ